jgi:hypothetical protein
MNTGLYGGKQKVLPQGQHSLEFRMSCAATHPVESKTEEYENQRKALMQMIRILSKLI